jgi:phage terminase small subunit
MSGVKGKSGGPRKNSGGARPGAGRKPKAKPGESANTPGKDEPAPLPATDDPLAFLMAVQNHPAVDIKTRLRAAIAAAQYKHTKRGDGGKKDEAADKAKKAGAGKFKSAPAPLALVRK